MNRFHRVLIVMALATDVASADDTTLYSAPWQLRSLTPADMVGVESSAAAFTDSNGNIDIAQSTVVGSRYHLTPEWVPFLRLGFVANNAPGAALDGTSFGNPTAGATYTRTIAKYRLAASLSTTLPIGTGGGDTPDPRAARVNTAAITARPADSAMFDVDYMTETLGIDVAYLSRGLTAQAEANVAQGIRTRGDGARFRTSADIALHAGYFLGSHVSLGTDLRYQRWLTRDAMTQSATDTLTLAVGLRTHVGLGEHASLHPGISYTRGLNARGTALPVITDQTNAVQIDAHVLF
jgi:hypothetical protein